MVGVAVDRFPFGRAAVVERAVQPAHVVPALDVVEHRPVQTLASRPGPGVDELALDGGEEALGHGIVPALALAPDREHDAVGPGQLGEVPARVLHPRSEWKMTPLDGRRVAKAIERASSTNSVRMCSASAQPTTRRLARSMTVAR